MLEISQKKQTLLIGLVKLGRGVVNTSMWEGLLCLHVLLAWDVPGASSPGCPSCCASTQRRLLVGPPLQPDRGYLLGVLGVAKPCYGHSTEPLCAARVL